ncbi:MAG: L,D-transpeptidase family protein [Actinomycetota bacterium]|nr:L,D-transpeptidase family protein [Actinomycetota bacterium]MDA3027586.1 L,D-transpeptidase family protein [Actinomycetota bacterium]
MNDRPSSPLSQHPMRWLPALGAAVVLLVVAISASPGSDDVAIGEVTVPAVSEPVAMTTTTTTIDPGPPAPSTPLGRVLERGVAGDDVAMVQQRLHDLGFDPGPIDGIYGGVTIQAVWAYEKFVLGTPRTEATGVVTPAMWDRMREPLGVVPRRATGGLRNHTEIYLPEQVMVVFQADVPVLITHISSGELDEFGQPAVYCEEVTYDTDNNGDLLEEPVTDFVCAYAKTPGGVFKFEREISGIRNGPLGDMWNPVYFNYGIAVHGALTVPLEPASHGCVRIPMHVSEYFQDLVELGETVLVWNGEAEPEDVTYEESLPSWWAETPPEFTTTTSTSTTSTTTTSTTTTSTTVATTTSTSTEDSATPND